MALNNVIFEAMHISKKQDNKFAKDETSNMTAWKNNLHESGILWTYQIIFFNKLYIKIAK